MEGKSNEGTEGHYDRIRHRWRHPALSPSAGEGCEHEFTGGKGAYPGQWSRCPKCKQIVLRPGGEGWVAPEVREQARKAIGHAFHLIEHNKAMCVRCREAKQRLVNALDALKKGK